MDYTLAANLFTQAARNGNARAQFELGRMYLKGLGVERDCAMTAAWIGKAANQNLAIAQTLFATLYLKGLCVLQDNATAKSWYAKAANLGDAAGQIMFGLMLADRKDYSKAMCWLRKGEANQVELLLQPEGEAKSIQISEKLKALAQYTIGLMYEAAAGVASSPLAGSRLVCAFHGSVGAMHFDNDGTRPSFGCSAHCDWIAGSTRFSGDLSTFDIGKNEHLDRWTKDYGATIDRSENAGLTCRSP
jgi:TPR repeat protein